MRRIKVVIGKERDRERLGRIEIEKYNLKQIKKI